MQKHLRLRRNSDFQRLRREGRAWKHPVVILSLSPNQLSHNRYGVIVGKRLGKAVVRNRLKRQLRACLRLTHENLNQGFDIVLIARHPILQAEYGEICIALQHVLKRANVLVVDSTS